RLRVFLRLENKSEFICAYSATGNRRTCFTCHSSVRREGHFGCLHSRCWNRQRLYCYCPQEKIPGFESQRVRIFASIYCNCKKERIASRNGNKFSSSRCFKSREYAGKKFIRHHRE